MVIPTIIREHQKPPNVSLVVHNCSRHVAQIAAKKAPGKPRPPPSSPKRSLKVIIVVRWGLAVEPFRKHTEDASAVNG